MEPIKNFYESDSDESSTLSLRDLPLHSNGEASQTHRPFSPSPDLFDFSFPLPPATKESNTSMSDVFLHGQLLPKNSATTPKLPPFVHRRADSLDGNDGEAHAVDYPPLRRACSDPRPPAGRWKKGHFFALVPVKFPAEMEMRDMRTRQRRQGPPELVECCGRRSCWSILRAMSCKAAESTTVAPLVAAGRAPGASTCRGIFRSCPCIPQQ
ncbi:uncharacterized protein LOC110110160 [Dendrobium catenatum]|uniref:uncharacterized protein LOC110110160 n=1 Tax=Dendrobium catenatum TaxID=906689 RepID=UPI00109EF131|nr:uncharacterized protein LOC110110160 [Dendrobium catenatum]